MATWAVQGTEYDEDQRKNLRSMVTANWNYVKFQSTLLALTVSFYCHHIWKRIKKFVHKGSHSEEYEFSEEKIKDMKNEELVFLSFLLPFFTNFLILLETIWSSNRPTSVRCLID